MLLAAAAGRLLAVAAGVLFAAAWVVLAPGTAEAQPEPSRERLRELDASIRAERAALDDFREAWEAEVAGKRTRFEERADRLRALRQERSRLETRRAELERRVRQAGAEQSTVEEALRTLRGASRGLAERLHLHLGEVPGAGSLRARAREALAALEPSRGSGAPQEGLQEGLREATAPLLELLDAVHAQATRVRVVESEVWTASERRETVSLLSAGHVAFAYRTAAADPASGAAEARVGVALASPRDASGYRWSEAIPDDDARAVGEAMARVRAGRGGAVAVPLDVSGELRAGEPLGRAGLVERLRSGGLVMVPLALLALGALGLTLERALVLYRANPSGEALAESVLAACRAGRPEEAERLCRAERGAVARTLEAGLAARGAGREAVEEAMQERVLRELPSLQRFLGGLAVLAAVAPLLGLLGTVTGIIETFGVIRALGSTEPSLMAGGISEALVTTATGLVLAIPILLVHSVLSSRADHLLAEAESYAATLANVLHEDAGADA